MKVVTSGSTYLDIDGYSGCIAYAELLRLQGQEAIAASTAVYNESITASVRSWGGELQRDHESHSGDEFVLIDVSEPKFFDKIVRLDAVSEVIDHHPGFEAYWQERLGDKAVIEFIGAACTLVYEKFVAAGKLGGISQTSARLLITGILDNTLNFKAHVTTDRDKKAYKQLTDYADLPAGWPAQYFSECQQVITNDLAAAIKNDVKSMEHIEGLPDWLGQLVIWDAAALLQASRPRITEIMSNKGGSWAMNIISINEGKNYLLADDPAVQANLARFLGTSFHNGIATTARLWLRKEIMKAAFSSSSHANIKP